MKSLLLILLLFYYTAGAQSLHIDSTRFITGINCCTQIFFTIPTADKGILFVGADNNNPGGIIPYFPIDTSGAGNVMIGKIDSNQKISWIKIYGGSEEEGANSACQLPDGGYAVLCTTSSSNGDVTNFHGGNDYWLLRLDDSGKLLWENCYGGPGGEQAASVALTPDGGFIMLGTTNCAGGEVAVHYGNEFDYDWWVVKTDSLGNLQWAQTLGGTGQETDAGTILAIDSAYYLISSSTSTDHNCTDTFWHPNVNTFYDYYVLKLDTGGNVLWDSSYGGSNDEDEAFAMFDTRDSTIVITGSTGSSNYMVTGYNGGVSDMWVIKVNRNGKRIWGKCIGGTNEDQGEGICTWQNGGYLSFGNTFPGPIGLQDMWLFALDSSGNEIANEIFGGTGPDDAYSVIPYLNTYVAAGESGSSVFTEGISNVNYSGAFISYLDYWPLSINNVSSNPQQLQVYPNPSQGVARIIIPATQSGNITIINCVGQLIYMHVTQSQQYIDINTSNWAKGLYIVKWQGEDGTVLTTKMVNE